MDILIHNFEKKIWGETPPLVEWGTPLPNCHPLKFQPPRKVIILANIYLAAQ